eukprot:TRINITY_DN37083_c0_g1_i1.p2 TRINITY_DN37083_c0_g1~~TRINITY_DN37083_c0_g1_i1.p2  ORF type:complete len:100 (-),score=22.65 TRINITY_DN37083_c0_g1_i1:737-1036(-)
MEINSMNAEFPDMAACDKDTVHSCPEMSDAESMDSRDSLESLLARGESYQARALDLEAYSFAQWWHALDVECQFKARNHAFRQHVNAIVDTLRNKRMQD